MADVNITIAFPAAGIPRIRAVAVARGFAGVDGTASNADVASFVRSIVKREVTRHESQRAGEAESRAVDSDLG